MPRRHLTWYLARVMSAAINQDFMSVKIVANFGSLLPWLPREVRYEFGEPGPAPDRDAASNSELSDPSLALAALHVSERLVRALFDESPISVAVFVPDGRLIRVNRAFGAMLGYDPTELTERNIEELMHPDDVAASREHRRQLAEGTRDAFEAEARFTPANRDEIWTRVSGRLHPSLNDQPPHIFVHLVEISTPQRVVEENQRMLENIILSSWGPSGTF